MKLARLSSFYLATLRLLICAGVALCSLPLHSQQTPTAIVPTLVNFSGVLSETDGKLLTTVTGVTFSFYAEQQGGSPLWIETQNVLPDKYGHYSVMLGSTTSQGLPASLFASGQARWLGVQIQGQEEQPRVMLLSVPYALKAGDAQTLGGMPVSSFVLTQKSASASGTTAGGSPAAAPALNNSPNITGSGQPGFLAAWSTTTNLADSKLFQNKVGNVGVDTTTPAFSFDVKGTVNSSIGYDLGGQPFAFGSYSKANALLGFAGNTTMTGQFNLGDGYQALASNTTGQDNTASGYQALHLNTTGPANLADGFQALYSNTTGGNNTATGYQALVFNTSGSSNTATGYQALQNNLTGQLNTALGIDALINNTGSNNTGLGALSLLFNVAGSGVTGLGYFAGPDPLSSGLTNATAIGANAVVSENNALVLGCTVGVNSCGSSVNVGIGTTTPAFTLDVRGTGSFTGPVNMASISSSLTVSGGDVAVSNGNLDLPAAGVINLGGQPFAFGAYNSTNVSLGFAGNQTMSGVNNTAVGSLALSLASSGNANTAVGLQALTVDSSGGNNTAIGAIALFNNNGNDNTAAGYNTMASNTSGGGNAAFGDTALFSNTTGSDNTAVGFGALGTGTGGNQNTCIGASCTVNGNLTNATAIGADAFVSQSNSLVLGCTSGVNGCGGNVNVGIATTTPSNILTIGKGAGHAISDGWDTYSSRRWKTNIETLRGALAKVEQLRGVSYDMKDSGKHEVGVIAEEVGAVVPEVVSWDKNGKDAQGVDYSRLTALLIEATKEQQKLIDKQEEQIRAQQAQIARLSSQVKAIRASLKTNGRNDSVIRRVRADTRFVHE